MTGDVIENVAKSDANISHLSNDELRARLEAILGRAMNLMNNPSGNFRPAFSPDGRWISFSSARDRPVTSNGFF